MSNNRVIFAEQLRVVAFMSVVITHWIGVFWRHADVVSRLTYSPAIEYNGFDPYEKLLLPLPSFNYGPFGVGLFFLISGFVMPFSIYHKSRLGFLKARILRIYPTYIASAFFSMIVAYSVAFYYWGVSPIIPALNVITNFTLVHMYFNIPSIDDVNWTLSIEVLFYIYLTTIRSLIVNKKMNWVMLSSYITSITLSLISLHYVTDQILSNFFHVLSKNFIYILYMLSGTLFYWHFKGDITTSKLISLLIVNLTFFFFSSSDATKLIPNPVTNVNFFYSLMLFSLCYLRKDSFKRNKVIDYLARISYPFYSLHAVLGYCLIKLLYSMGLGFYEAIFFVFIAVLGIATIINLTLERRVILLGKKFS